MACRRAWQGLSIDNLIMGMLSMQYKNKISVFQIKH